jgi:hypothetical protein
MNTNTMPTPFALDFDLCTEGYANAYAAVGGVLADSVQPESAIVSIEYKGEEANGWPTMLITFASIECAKAFTYAYLGYNLSSKWDVHTDEEVGEYISHGKFVNS